MKGAAETKQVTTLTLSMTPQEAKNLATAAEDARDFFEKHLHLLKSASAALSMKEMENLIAALGMGLANCPRHEPEEPRARHDDYSGGCDSCGGGR